MKYEIRTTETFDRWLNRVKDKSAVTRILSRIYRFEQGNLGDVKTIAANLFEARLFFGSGYRIYYTITEGVVVLLLCGGDKSSQIADVKKAINLMEKA